MGKQQKKELKVGSMHLDSDLGQKIWCNDNSKDIKDQLMKEDNDP